MARGIGMTKRYAVNLQTFNCVPESSMFHMKRFSKLFGFKGSSVRLKGIKPDFVLIPSYSFCFGSLNRGSFAFFTIVCSERKFQFQLCQSR